MDGRRALWIAGGILAGVIGCNRSETRPPGMPPPPPKVKAAPAPTPVAYSKNDKADEEPATFNAKPASCVHIGDFKTQLATDPTRGASEREVFAQQAKNSYERALQKDPKFVKAWMGLGTLSEGIGDRDEAIKYYQAALKLEPGNVAAYIGIARTYENSGHRDEALSVYRSGTDACPKKAELWYEYGMCLGRAKQFDSGLGCLYRAAKLRPSTPDYNKAVGLMLARMGQADEALVWLSKAMPEADARYNLARMLQHIGQNEASQEQAALAVKVNPVHIASLKMLAERSANGTPARPENVQPAEYRPNDSFQSRTVIQTSTLPSRPETSPAASASPPASLPQMPLMPDLEPAKPAAKPPVITVAPSKDGSASQPKIIIGFEEK